MQHHEIPLAQQLAEAFTQLPEVILHSTTADQRVDGRHFDLVILAEVKGHPVRVLVEIKAAGYPRDMQTAAWQLAGVRQLDQPIPDMPLVAAPAISEAARVLLREHHLGYWDTGGSLYL